MTLLVQENSLIMKTVRSGIFNSCGIHALQAKEMWVFENNLYMFE